MVRAARRLARHARNRSHRNITRGAAPIDSTPRVGRGRGPGLTPRSAAADQAAESPRAHAPAPRAPRHAGMSPMLPPVNSSAHAASTPRGSTPIRRPRAPPARTPVATNAAPTPRPRRRGKGSGTGPRRRPREPPPPPPAAGPDPAPTRRRIRAMRPGSALERACPCRSLGRTVSAMSPPGTHRPPAATHPPSPCPILASDRPIVRYLARRGPPRGGMSPLRSRERTRAVPGVER